MVSEVFKALSATLLTCKTPNWGAKYPAATVSVVVQYATGLNVSYIIAPTSEPTQEPSQKPTMQPTIQPTMQPSQINDNFRRLFADPEPTDEPALKRPMQLSRTPVASAAKSHLQQYECPNGVTCVADSGGDLWAYLPMASKAPIPTVDFKTVVSGAYLDAGIVDNGALGGTLLRFSVPGMPPTALYHCVFSGTRSTPVTIAVDATRVGETRVKKCALYHPRCS